MDVSNETTKGEVHGNIFIVGAAIFSIALGFYVESRGIPTTFMTFGGLLMAGALYSGRK